MNNETWTAKPVEDESGLILLTEETAFQVEQRRQLEAIEAEEAEFEALAGPKQGHARTDIKIGICRQCSRQRTLWRPANLCEKCLRKAAEDAGINPDDPFSPPLGKISEEA